MKLFCYSYYIFGLRRLIMPMPYKLKDHICRFCKMYALDDAAVPKALFEAEAVKPVLKGFPYPLPSKKADYTCSAKTGEIEWYGASNGLTRYDASAERYEDKLMYFSAPRDLLDNNIKALLPDGDNLWVLTETAVTYIEMKLVGAEEKADILRAESEKYVDRRGMKSQKRLREGRNLDSILPYGHSDNDGCFTAAYAIGEIFRYAVYKREKGVDHPDTILAKKYALRSTEATLLLMHISGRGDGFVARTYLCPDEPVPDDGIFFRKNGDTAVCLETSNSLDWNCVGAEIYCGAPIPERLSKLYTDLGYSHDGIVYKADTSSDEISAHFLFFKFVHDILGPDDPELDEIVVSTCKTLMNHIIDNGYILRDFTGKSTSWAKWNEEYFNSDMGYVDACLNSSELLMYHLVTMDVTGEQGKWRDSYEYLINEKHYDDYAAKHFDRLFQASISMEFDFTEDIMYGDHMLACLSYFGLCLLEKDPVRLEKYRNGFRSWRTSLEREHNPGYDIPFMVSCPDDEVDIEALATWFYRTNASRLAAGVSLEGRHDIPVKTLMAGNKEISVLLPPDERFISKYDRNPVALVNEDSGGVFCVESAYVYGYAYWMGRYYGFFE